VGATGRARRPSLFQHKEAPTHFRAILPQQMGPALKSDAHFGGCSCLGSPFCERVFCRAPQVGFSSNSPPIQPCHKWPDAGYVLCAFVFDLRASVFVFNAPALVQVQVETAIPPQRTRARAHSQCACTLTVRVRHTHSHTHIHHPNPNPNPEPRVNSKPPSPLVENHDRRSKNLDLDLGFLFLQVTCNMSMRTHTQEEGTSTSNPNPHMQPKATWLLYYSQNNQNHSWVVRAQQNK
jgi:hypothetical protein